MNLIWTIIGFVLMLGVTISIHEAGHMIVAKLCGVYVHEYSIGMGPKLWEKQGKETKYQLRAIPIGGFVSMAGENVNTNEEEDVHVPEDRKFYNQPYLKKVAILVAGVMTNFLLAIILFSCLMTYVGSYAEPIPATVDTVRENSPAERAGFLPGDEIVRITREDGSSMKIDSFFDMKAFTDDITDQETLTYELNRDGNTVVLEVKPEWVESENDYLIGIQARTNNVHEVHWYNGLWYGIRYFWDQLGQLFSSLKLLFMANGWKQVSGPVGMATVTSKAVSMGFWSYIYLVGLINLNIGVMNLLPLPVLDGGQIVVETVEKVVGKRIPEKVKIAIMGACWILLIGLMIAATWNDIGRLID